MPLNKVIFRGIFVFINQNQNFMKTKLFFISIFLTTIIYSQLPQDAVAKYTFTNGSLINVVDPGNGDLSGKAVPSNLLKLDRFGAANNAIRSQSITRNGFVFTGTTNELSISFWVQGSAPTSGSQRIFHVFDSSGDGFSMRSSAGSSIVARFKNDGIDNQSSQSGSSIFNGNWHHIVYTIKRSAAGYDNRVYIDGVIHTKLSSTIDSNNNTNFLTSNSTFVISPLSGSQGYFGNIDDVDIFKRELNPVEVESIYLNDTPAVVFVNLNATGNNDGTSWTDAYNNLQDAINNTSNGKQIWVAAGTYFPKSFAISSQQTNRDKTFLINKGVFIYGGFNGTETAINQRDFINNKTILSGDVNQDDSSTITPTESTRQDNLFHIVTVKGYSVYNPILDGFTITGGNANSTQINVDCNTASSQQFDKRRGAAIYMNLGAAGSKVAIDITNCIIENNSANGMAVLHTFNPCGSGSTISDVNFTSSIIRDNYSIDNSNIYYGASKYSIKRYGSIVNSLMHDNTTVNQASTINLSANAAQRSNLDVNIINSTISNNSSNSGKVIRLSEATGVKMYNTIIYNNANNDLDLLGSLPTTFANNLIEFGQFSGINQDPLFTDHVNNDYTLQSGSPAIDTGDNSKTPSRVTVDLAINNRIFNTTVDIGAYEFGASPLSILDNNALIETLIYPNPVINELKINSKEEIQKIEIYNLLGKKVLEKGNSSFINLTGLKSNIYIVKIYSNTKSIMKRIIKK